jgi:hypothetical protein
MIRSRSELDINFTSKMDQQYPLGSATMVNNRENHNPHNAAINNNNTMGPQSQFRLSMEKRTHHMQASNAGYRKKKKVGDTQVTLFGREAFDPLKHCEVCKGRIGGRNPHRRHHPLCYNNRRTKGVTSQATLESLQVEKKLAKLFAAPLKENEKGSLKHLTKDNLNKFFAPRNNAKNKSSVPEIPSPVVYPVLESLSDSQFSQLVVNKLKDESFAREHSNNRAPLAMIAAASVIVENIIRPDKGSSIKRYFHGITMIIPHVMDCTDPFYHSISGQKLLLVDWKKMLGVDVVCPKCKQCHLKNDRTNFSKNKVLFPIFGLDGPPSWAMVMSMQCPSCKIRFSANDSTILCRLPAYASSFYPVDTRYALANKNCHLSRSATDIFDSILPTYGNADLCSRLLYKAINRAYLERAASYFSLVAECRGSKVTSMVNATVHDTMQDIVTAISRKRWCLHPSLSSPW